MLHRYLKKSLEQIIDSKTFFCLGEVIKNTFNSLATILIHDRNCVVGIIAIPWLNNDLVRVLYGLHTDHSLVLVIAEVWHFGGVIRPWIPHDSITEIGLGNNDMINTFLDNLNRESTLKASMSKINSMILPFPTWSSFLLLILWAHRSPDFSCRPCPWIRQLWWLPALRPSL